jgi:hypothetical protein
MERRDGRNGEGGDGRRLSMDASLSVFDPSNLHTPLGFQHKFLKVFLSLFFKNDF